MDGNLQARFGEALVKAYQTAVDECGYRGNYALRMLNELGPVEAARRLIDAEVPAEGFTRLWECQRLDLTVEAIAIDEEFAALFAPEELERACDRLRQYGYDFKAR